MRGGIKSAELGTDYKRKLVLGFLFCFVFDARFSFSLSVAYTSRKYEEGTGGERMKKGTTTTTGHECKCADDGELE